MLVLLIAVAGQAADGSAQETQDVEQQIRRLIPAASAIDTAVFEKIATSPEAPTVDSFPEMTLSAALMLLTLDREAIRKPDADFRYLTDGSPKPARLAEEMYHAVGAGRLRVAMRPVTLIQLERITEFAVKIDEDRAEGTFAFRVPELYEGRAKFSAVKTNNGWKIQAFRMPGVHVHVALNEMGRWRRVDEESSPPSKGERTNQKSKDGR